ncbi:MAG TPA: hypothetical protein VIT91_06880 [Chthoniobacterales bacterium]
MKDPFYARILFAIESKIHEGDRLAASRGSNLTDSNIRSLVVRASHAAKGKRPQPVPESAGAKDKFLAELLGELIVVRDSISVEERSSNGTMKEHPIPAADWIQSLEAIKESCAIRTGNEPGSRGYLDFLAGFIAQAGGRK